ncbi:MAG: LytTR family DNA-binding domain-containing protein [Acidobacteriota bacterium]
MKKVLIKLGRKYHLIDKNDINFIESDGNYSRINCENKSLLVKRSLNFLEQKLGSDKFVRVNRSILVNIELISEMEESENDYLITLKNNRSFNWSRRYRERLTKLMRI